SIFAGIAGLCLLVLVLFAWNRTLRKRVEKHSHTLINTEEILRKSEEKFRHHIESSTDVIFTLNASGIFMFVSPAWERHFGYHVDEVQGFSFAGFSHPDDIPPLIAYLHRVLSTGQTETSPPYRVKCANGSWRPFEANGSTFVDSSGELLFIGVGHDISERIEKERALLEKEQMFRAFFEQGYYFAGLLNTDGTLIDVNFTALHFGGLEKSDVIGKPFWETPWWMHSPELQEKLRQAVTSAAQGEIATFEATHPTPDGALHYIDFSLRPVKDPSGTVLFLVPEGRDITERKKTEEERLNLERQLLHTQKLESLGILSGGIAHDFNNLLQALLGNLELALMRLPGETPVRKNIDQAIKAGRQAAKLTNMMLAYSGKGLFVIRPLNLSTLVEENATMLDAAIPKSISLVQHLDNSIPIIRADAGQLQQVIMNLITNAAEAIGNANGVITLETGIGDFDQLFLNKSSLDEKTVAGRYVWLMVSDNGCGMDGETLRKLFDPFFTTKFTGRGLGMSAVLGIIRAHKGAFLVESAPESGTTIKVLFPTADIQTAAVEIDNKDVSAQYKLIGRSLKVLVVDDEDMVRDVSTSMFDELGFETLVAASGEEALGIFRKESNCIDVVLLDQVMPNMDGVTVFKELRKVQPGIKVLLASGFSQQEVSERFKGLGLTGFIQKPYTLESLTTELKRILN
ncbi:MAG: PAS domain S-box protein, partial [Desulfuromonadales bacterium]